MSESENDKPLSLQPLDGAEPSKLTRPAHDSDARPLSAHEIRRQRREEHYRQQRDAAEQRAPTQKGGDLAGAYFLLTTGVLMFGLWFAGPKLVEEYHYAATAGATRAEYEHASTMLESDPLASVSYAYRMVAQKVRPSVVSITATKSDGTIGSLRGMSEFGLGSGVIISSDGYIVTNSHVLDGGQRFYVELHDRRRFSAALIGSDKESDLALLKIESNGLLPAQWGDSDDLDVGSIVWAFGSPYQLKQTVTSGIISAKDRPGVISRENHPDRVNFKQLMLQTDAAINRGNSGGPLVNSRGQVIGINTSILGETFQGIGFAVPSATAQYVIEHLQQQGKVTRGFLGATPMEVSNADLRRFGLPDMNGAKLRNVVSGSPADRAGIRSYDVIRSWGGVPIRDYKRLYFLTEQTPPNSVVDVTLIRDGQELQTQVQVGDRELALGLGR